MVRPFVKTFYISCLIIGDTFCDSLLYFLSNDTRPMPFVFSKGRLVEVALTPNSKSSGVLRKEPSAVSKGVLQLF